MDSRPKGYFTDFRRAKRKGSKGQFNITLVS